MTNSKRILKKKINTTGTYLILLIVAFFTLMPFLWMLLSSFKSLDQIFASPVTLFPTEFTFKNYITIFKDYNFGRALFNSFYIGVIATGTSIFFCALAGYAFSKLKFKGKNILFLSLVRSLMIPFQVTMVPAYALFNQLHWIDKHIGLIVPGMANAFGIFFMRQYMSGINYEIIESGRIDGCSEFGIFIRLILPIARPAMASLGIIFFMNSWNNFLWPMIILKSSENMTVAVAIRAFNSGVRTPYNLIMAASFVSIIPLLIVFIAFQKEFISGITKGAVKG
ncbi:MAG: carbohydrate ABC transporter permease [Vallitaleaceae bacterium]|jgi:ABC-type glycerol-3-phosphate transport system permease component|nr:carbohydrate ABC transporter permease [Vallitaleaceae bacterium]